MQHVKQYEITLENGECKIINETDLKRGHMYWTEVGPGFGMECVTEIRQLPDERILDEGGSRAPESK